VDVGLLESAVARARNLVSYKPEATLADVAASLGWGLIRNHAFVDGNKRIGLAAMVVFLKAHGCVLTCSGPEETTMVLRAASSQISEDEWTDWVGRNVGPEG
jgi:death-on-curing protein